MEIIFKKGEGYQQRDIIYFLSEGLGCHQCAVMYAHVVIVPHDSNIIM